MELNNLLKLRRAILPALVQWQLGSVMARAVLSALFSAQLVVVSAIAVQASAVE